MAHAKTGRRRRAWYPCLVSLLDFFPGTRAGSLYLSDNVDFSRIGQESYNEFELFFHADSPN